MAWRFGFGMVWGGSGGKGLRVSGRAKMGTMCIWIKRNMGDLGRGSDGLHLSDSFS
jgi:hypothetical protein